MADQHRMPTHHPRIIGTRHMVSSANYLAAAGRFLHPRSGRQCDRCRRGGWHRAWRTAMRIRAFRRCCADHDPLGGDRRDGVDQRPWAVAEAGQRGVVPRASGRPHPVQHQALRGAGGAGCLDHRAGTLRHHELRRRCRGGDPLRPRRLRLPVDFARGNVGDSRCHPPLPAERGDISAEWRGAKAWNALLPDRSRQLDPVHGGPGSSRRTQGRACRGARGRARCILPWRYRAEDRRLSQGERWLAAGRRSRGVPFGRGDPAACAL